MAQSIEDSLLQAIKKDDLKAFDALAEESRLRLNKSGAISVGKGDAKSAETVLPKDSVMAYRLGRFPILSLLYLYKSRWIIAKYEEKLLQLAYFEELKEPVEISKKFAGKAGKCLRLYFDEIVSPLEMLLILDDTSRLKRLFPMAKPSSGVKGRLKAIYSIKYSLNVKFEGNSIVLDRRPLSYREKRKLFTICLSALLIVAIVVGVPVTTVSLIPKPIEGEVYELSQIDFNSSKQYTLKNDITIPEGYSCEKISCEIVGGGKKLIVKEGASLGELNGKLSGLTIESSGEPIFTSITEYAEIKNSTLNVKADISTDDSTALFALTNYGTIDGLTVNVSGKINAVAPEVEPDDDEVVEHTVGGIIWKNDYKYNASFENGYVWGVIQNCSVNYSNFELSGETGANAEFAGITAINNGTVRDCTVGGKITSDTFDVAGACIENNRLLSNVVNNADISQSSSDTDWNPIVAGIVINNAYAVDSCKNAGKILSVSTCGEFEVQENTDPSAAAAGIAHISRGTQTTAYLKDCENSGEIEVSAIYRTVYAAGLCVSSSGPIEAGKNAASVSAKGNDKIVYAGGITALSYGSINKSENKGNISGAGNGSAYVGGISAYAFSMISNCVSSGNISVSAKADENKNVCAGGILGYSDVAVDSLGFVYFGFVEQSMFDGRLSVTNSGGTPAFVGGIVGCVNERNYGNENSPNYFGGGVTGSIFIGEAPADITYFGNIAGAVGVNIYEKNSFFSGTTEYHNFEGNLYIENALSAFGTSQNADGTFAPVEDKGAKSDSRENILNSEEYKAIFA